MNKKIIPAEAVAVIVARFEVASLTEGHKQMLDYVLGQNYGTNLLVLGVSPLMSTKNNPLDFESRRLMIEQEYPGKFTIMYLKDCPDDTIWSKRLDELIGDICGLRDVVLVGSRDSFFEHYNGRFTENFDEFKQTVFISGTQQRASLAKQLKASPLWRAGVVYATQNHFPTVYSTVDCAIFDDDSMDSIYLARKKDEKLLRFVGGFSDPKDESFEVTARREATEETGLECSNFGYVSSHRIDDWRYRNEEDKIITHLFVLVKTFGRPHAQDDISELRLVKFDELDYNDVVPEHRILLDDLRIWRNKYKLNHIDIKTEVGKMMG